MNKIVSALLVSLISLSSPLYAERITLVDGSGNEVGTESNPIKSSLSGLSSVGDPDSSDSVVGGTYAKLDFDYPSNGTIRAFTTEGVFKNALDLKLDSAYAEAVLSGVSNLRSVYLNTILRADRVLAGGVQRMAGENLTAKSVSYYKLDEKSGTSFADSAGSNTGTLVGSADISLLTANDGVLGGAGRFRSGDGVWIDLGSDASLKVGSGDFTVCGMVRTYKTDPATSERWAGNRLATSTNIGYEFSIQANALNSGYGASVRFAFDMGATVYQIDSTSRIDDGRWHMVCGRRSGSTLSLFFDGVSEGTPSGSSSASIAAAGNTYIGGTPQSSDQFNGDVDQYYVFSDDLTDAEIVAICNADSDGNCRGISGLVSESATKKPNIMSTNENETSTLALNDANDLLVGDDAEVKGDFMAGDYFSGDGSQGASGSTCTEFKDGLCTAAS